MVNYVTKSISLFSTVSLILLMSCGHDSTWNVPPASSIPVEPLPAAPTSAPPAPITPPVVVQPPPPPCPTGMVLVHNGHFCIDQYEWPNQKGALPDFALTAFQAEAFCQSVHKRLCTHTEWVNACLSKDNLAYGYGPKWIQGTCNDSVFSNYIPVDWNRMGDGPSKWKEYARTLYKGVPSGSRGACFSDQGEDKVYDMIGNVREWVKDPSGYGGYAFESSFWYGTMVGPAGCGFEIRAHAPGFASYEVGTRCCSDP